VAGLDAEEDAGEEEEVGEDVEEEVGVPLWAACEQPVTPKKPAAKTTVPHSRGP
jgi:hypothetical protein